MRIRQPIRELFYITVPFNVWYIYGKHKGLDFRTKTEKNPSGINTPIEAVASGEWKEVGYNKSLGNFVKLKHKDGFVSIYGHLISNTYKPGYKKVKAGDVIGFSGNTGTFTTGAHLHLQIEKDGIPVDPLPLIESGNKLKDWVRARGIMRVGGRGEIMFQSKQGLTKLTKENCWNIISQNTWGISENDYNDLLDLI